jgi:predicted permease
MRHPLNWLLRFGLSESDRQAILGDLEEEYRSRVRPARGWVGAQRWYAREVLAAVGHQARNRTRAADRGGSMRQMRLGPRGLFRDVRHALRRLRRRPGFTATAILTLALGIGTTTAFYSVVDAVLLSPLPWRDGERLVSIYAVHPERLQDPARAATWNRGTVSGLAWDALRESKAFETVEVWEPAPAQTVGEDRQDVVPVIRVSSGFLPMLGVRVQHGRYFSPEEDEHRSDVALITHEAWLRHLGGRPDVVGETVLLGAVQARPRAHTIVGVLEPGFAFGGERPEFLVPVGPVAESSRQYGYATRWHRPVARLAPGATLDSAAAAAVVAVSATEIRELTSARVVSIREEEVGASAGTLWLLLAATGVLMLVASVNLAGLLLGEATARGHEVAIRSALGGSRLRLLRELVVEHALLIVAGTGAGLVVAWWMTGAFAAAAPAGLPRIEDVAIDTRVATFAALLGASTLLVFGLAPALPVVRTAVARSLAGGGTQATAGRGIVSRGLVPTEIGLALALLVGAALFGETIYRLTSQPLGFDPANVAVVSTEFLVSERTLIRDPVQLLRPPGPPRLNTASLAAAVVERLRAIPQVEAAAGVSSAPFIGVPGFVEIRPHGQPTEVVQSVQRVRVTPGYFALMGMPLLSGRDFERSDMVDPAVAVVSADFERRFLAGDAVGRRVDRLYGEDRFATHLVIGVVPDVRQRGFDDEESATIYLPGAVEHFLVRTTEDSAATLPAAREAVQADESGFVVTSTTWLQDALADTIAAERFRASLSALFGGAALVLAAVGLYGLTSRRVTERRREIGVRVALGAGPSRIRRLVLRDGFLNVALGLALGLPAAFAASQLTAAYLYGVTPTSPRVFAAAALVLGAVALVATLLPARRASRIDPVTVLKE